VRGVGTEVGFMVRSAEAGVLGVPPRVSNPRPQKSAEEEEGSLRYSAEVCGGGGGRPHKVGQ
jgi:hypothetical protein